MFNSMMHVAFYTDKWDEMLDFYTNKLGFKLKTYVKFKEYLNRPDRKQMYEIALKDPERPFNAYIEVAPGQFIELFPAMEGQKPHTEWNEFMGYSHFALMTDDIFIAYNDCVAAGIKPRNEPSKGPSGTWQFWIHDPDYNWFEIMQYTEDSYQVKGHFSE